MIYWAPIHYAAKYGRHDFIHMFIALRSDMDVNITTIKGKETIMHILAHCGHTISALSLRNNQNIDRNAKDAYGRNAMLTAVSTGHADVAQVFGLDAAADVNATDIWVCFIFMVDLFFVLLLEQTVFLR